MFCCLSPAGQKFSVFKNFPFSKKNNKIWSSDVHVHMASLQMSGSVWKSFQASLCYSGPESLTIPKWKLLAIYNQDQRRTSQRVGHATFKKKITGHLGLLCDWASSSNKTLSRSGLTRLHSCIGIHLHVSHPAGLLQCNNVWHISILLLGQHWYVLCYCHSNTIALVSVKVSSQ